MGRGGDGTAGGCRVVIALYGMNRRTAAVGPAARKRVAANDVNTSCERGSAIPAGAAREAQEGGSQQQQSARCDTAAQSSLRKPERVFMGV